MGDNCSDTENNQNSTNSSVYTLDTPGSKRSYHTCVTGKKTLPHGVGLRLNKLAQAKFAIVPFSPFTSSPFTRPSSSTKKKKNSS